MRTIGMISVVLFLASLTAFMAAFSYPEYVRTGGLLGAVFLAAAVLVLGVTIRNRRQTERI